MRKNQGINYIWRWMLSGLMFCLSFIGLLSVAHADSINYQTFKYGTFTTSMADGYYVKPAQITVSGNKYVITMTIRTANDLTAWPVVVNSIDGQAPQNVSKTRSGSSYDYSYSFTESDLNKVISSNISINVPGVYTATHNISFKFDTSDLPSKSGGNSQTESTTAVGTNDPSLNTKLKKLTSQASSQSKAASKKESQLAVSISQQNLATAKQNRYNAALFYYVLVIGLVGLVILIGSVGYFIWRGKYHPRH